MAGPVYNNPGTSLPVRYAHTVDYFSKGVDTQSAFYKVRYLIDNWADSDAFVNALRGFSSNTGGSGGSTTRSSPHQHPLSPNLFCVSAEAVGNGPPVLNASGYPSYAAGAIITAEYRPMVPMDYVTSPDMLQQQIDPSTPLLWCTQSLDYTSEFITIANSQVKWSAGPHNGQPIAGLAYRVRVPITIINLVFHVVPYFPSGVPNLQGFINNATFLECATGTVYFSGCRIDREANTDGSVAQKLALTFMRRTGKKSSGAPGGATDQLWNSLPDPSDLNWYPVAGSGGKTLYDPADFTPLLQF